MKAVRLLLISLLTIIAFIFFFHSAEASPIDRLSLPLTLPAELPTSLQPSASHPDMLLAPDANADINLVMVDSPDPVSPGSTLVYTMTVVNNGPERSGDMVLTDTLPLSTTLVTYTFTVGTWTCGLRSGNQVVCNHKFLNPGIPSNITLVVLVSPNAPASISNTAIVKSLTNTDPVPSNNIATETTTVTYLANLGLSITDSPDPVSPDNDLTYNVTVNNAGPTQAVGVEFTDTLPPGVTYQSYSATGWTCTLQGSQLRCVMDTNMAAGASSQVTIITHVNPGTPLGTLTNTAIVSSTTQDPDLNNNSASASTTVSVFTDLQISMTDSPDPVTPGTNMGYALVITNNGPSDAVGVKITDTLPAGVSFIIQVPQQDWNCTSVGGQIRCSKLSPLAAYQSVQLSLGVAVSSNVTSPFTNVITVGAATFDPITTNNSDTETTGIYFQSDLSLFMSESVDPVTAGTNLNYTLVVANTGPSIGVNLVVIDSLPPNLTFLSYGGNIGWTCVPLTGNRVQCTRSSLNVGANSTVTILTRVASGATGTLDNTAVVSSTGTDPAPGNNSAGTSTTVTQSADLLLTKTDSPDPVAEGQPLTYRVVVKNNGPSDSANVVLNDTLPPEVTFVSAVTVPSRTCSGTAPVSCSLGNLVSGSSITLTLTTTAKPVANQTKTIYNTAQVTSPTQDPNTSNNSQTITTQVQPVADLRINVESRLTTVQTGNPLTYTLWITNTGPSIALNVVVTDTLPAELTFKSSSRTPAVTSPKVVWNLGNMGVGQAVSFRLVVNVKSPTKTLVNQVLVRASTWDLVPANSQDQVSVNAVDSVPPVATWKLPVPFQGVYFMGRRAVLLEVLATDNVAVDHVFFNRWDSVHGVFVDIGTDYTPATCQFNPAYLCFQVILDTHLLNPKWNEIRARAFDGSGNASPEPKYNSYIFIYLLDKEVFLPIVKK